MAMICSLWDYGIKEIFPLLSKEDFEMCDLAKSKKSIDHFFSDRSLGWILISHRFKTQKETPLGKIENCGFYKKIIKSNEFVLAVEEYCNQKYGVKVLSGNNIGVASQTYSEENMLDLSLDELMEKKELVKLVQSNGGFNENNYKEVLSFLKERTSCKIINYEIELVAHQTNNFTIFHDDNCVLIGSNIEKKILEEYLNRHIPFIEYGDIEKKDFEVKKYRYVLLLHPVCRGILADLWKMGYSIEQKVIMPKKPVFSVGNFIGQYCDVWGNDIFSESLDFRVDITGFGARASISSEIKGGMTLNLATDSSAKIGRTVVTTKTSIGLLYGSRLEIGDGTVFDEKNIIRMGPFTHFWCGKNCFFGKEIWTLAGDGHSIFDINSSERINYKSEMLNTDKLGVFIGNNVKIGNHSTIIAGCRAEDNSIFYEDSLLNKRF